MKDEHKAKARAGRQRDQSVDKAIMASATDTLRESGYGAFSIERVAARAGVAKQSIYRRWPSKGALLLDIYMDGMNGDHEPRLTGCGLAEDLRAYLNQTVLRLKDAAWTNTLRSIVAEAQSDEQLRALVIEKMIEPRREAGRQVLRSAIASGEIASTLDEEVILDLIFGAVWYRLLLRDIPVDGIFVEKMIEIMTARTR